MGKIYKALSWFTLGQASQHLSAAFGGEKVSLLDVVQLVTEEKLPLYWYLQGKKAQETIPDNNMFPQKVQFQPDLEKTDILLGHYRLDLQKNPSVKDFLLSLILGEANGFSSVHSLVVEGEDGKLWEILDFVPDGIVGGENIPSGMPPELSALVLKKTDLEGFEESLIAEPAKPASALTKERETLFKLILGMAQDAYSRHKELDIRC